MAIRTCTVSCSDLQGVKHTVDVTAESLYEAVAVALEAFRENDWVGEFATGLSAITVVVQQPAIEHQVSMQKFEHWLKGCGRSPAEAARRSELRKRLGR